METKLYRFAIYHPKGGNTNEACKLEDLTYEYVASVSAQNIVRSFYLAQNKLNPEYAKLGKRDTGVGDVIAADDKLFIITESKLFKRIPKTRELYKSIMETDEAIIEILSRQTLTEEDVNRLIDNCY